MKNKRESIEDLNESYGFDISSEMEEILVSELSNSINSEIFKDIFGLDREDLIRNSKENVKILKREMKLEKIRKITS